MWQTHLNHVTNTSGQASATLALWDSQVGSWICDTQKKKRNPNKSLFSSKKNLCQYSLVTYITPIIVCYIFVFIS